MSRDLHAHPRGVAPDDLHPEPRPGRGGAAPPVSIAGTGVRRVLPAQAGEQAVLALQRSAGNRAVRGLLRPAGKAGAGRALLRWAETASAELTLQAIEAATTDELRAMLSSLDAGPANGHVAVTAPNQTIAVDVADATDLRVRVVEKLTHKVMEELEAARRPIVARMGAATGAGAERRTAMNDLHTSDAPRLAELRRLTGGTRWEHPDAAVQDAVLAAIQLEAVFRAEARASDPTQAHTDAARACGMDMTHDWCGFFVAENFMQSNLDSDLRGGFFHTENVVDYFTYRYERFPTRVKKWIWADGAWQELGPYHALRGSSRRWTDAAAIFSSLGLMLDIRPGDVVLIDHSGSGRPDHIAMVDSYDPGTGALFTIGGNDSGYTVDTRPAHTAPPRETPAERAKRERLEAATGRPLVPGGGGGVGFDVKELLTQPDPAVVEADPSRARPRVRVFGIGRPSIVDFEEHFYDGTRLDRAPAAAPAHR